MWKQKESEEEIAAKLVSYLNDNGWDVYEEVTLGYRVVDIVCKDGPLVHCIEVKKGLTLQLLEQILYCRDRAHLISVAVPYTYKRKYRFVLQILHDYGIGLYEIGYNVQERIAPRLFRKAPRAINTLANLLPEHKCSGHAGNASGQRSTQFKRTADTIYRIVVNEPGIEYASLFTNTSFHYASKQSARICIKNRIEDGTIKGIKFKRVRVCNSKRIKLCLYPVLFESNQNELSHSVQSNR